MEDMSDTTFQEATIPAEVPATLPETPQQASTFNLADHIPEELKGKGWVQKLQDKPLPEWLKSMDNAQQLLGKQNKVFPEKDAAPEVWQEFFNNLKPEDVKAYKLNFETGNPEQDKFNMELAKAMQESGLHPNQANSLIEKFNGLVEGQQSKNAEAYSEEAFQKEVSSIFGDRTEEVTAKMAEFFGVLEPNDKKVLQELPNKALVSVMKAFDKYTASNNIANQKPITNKEAPASSADLHKELQNAIANHYKINPLNAEAKQANQDKINRLSQQIYGGNS